MFYAQYEAIFGDDPGEIDRGLRGPSGLKLRDASTQLAPGKRLAKNGGLLVHHDTEKTARFEQV